MYENMNNVNNSIINISGKCFELFDIFFISVAILICSKDFEANNYCSSNNYVLQQISLNKKVCCVPLFLRSHTYIFYVKFLPCFAEKTNCTNN